MISSRKMGSRWERWGRDSFLMGKGYCGHLKKLRLNVWRKIENQPKVPNCSDLQHLKPSIQKKKKNLIILKCKYAKRKWLYGKNPFFFFYYETQNFFGWFDLVHLFLFPFIMWPNLIFFFVFSSCCCYAYRSFFIFFFIFYFPMVLVVVIDFFLYNVLLC